jgi:hypothetical protein
VGAGGTSFSLSPWMGSRVSSFSPQLAPSSFCPFQKGSCVPLTAVGVGHTSGPDDGTLDGVSTAGPGCAAVSSADVYTPAAEG